MANIGTRNFTEWKSDYIFRELAAKYHCYNYSNKANPDADSII